jgi:predicted unusual protein kinase regulating ubiquinone biosynthesis (AarF/ABC1/UbiB family)
VRAEDAPTSHLARGARILRFLTRYWRAGVFDVDNAARRRVDPQLARAFAADLEALGPAFIKVGQALSTRGDMVPPEFATALERMQDGVEQQPWAEMSPVIESALGAPVTALFSWFDPEPIGSASLAQVYRARLHNGRTVAVKVQRPGIEAQVMQDLYLLERAARAADRLTRVGHRVRFADWIGEFRHSLRQELDYYAEADHLERFAAHLEPYDALRVPRPVRSHTRHNVLTMDLVDGVRVDAAQRSVDMERCDELAADLVRAYLDQVLVHGEIHADPHPGNLLLTPDGRLALIDLGMLTNVSPARRDRLMRLLAALVEGRGEDVADEAAAIGLPLEDFDLHLFRRDISRLVSQYASREHAAPAEGRLLFDIVRLSTAHALRPPPELSLLGRAMLSLDAVRQALSPQLDVRAVMDEHLATIAAERLRGNFTRTHLASNLHDLQSLLQCAPRRLDNVLSILAENRLQVRLTGLEEAHLVENLQKIANRIAAGVVTAALILASVLMMRTETGPQILGYPAFALILFLLASVLGLCIVLGALIYDRSAPRRGAGPGR